MKRLSFFLLLLSLGFELFSQDVEKLGANDSVGKYMKVNDILMYYEIYGSGHPLLLVHGNNGSMRSFYYQVKELKKKYQVIAVDSRAQGRSTDSPKELTYSLMASDLAVLLDSLGLDSVFFYGHSDGANIGLELAFAHPEKIEKMVLGSGNFICDTNAIFPFALDEVNKWKYPDFNPDSTALIYTASKDRQEDSIKFEKLRAILLNYPNFSVEQLSTIQTPTLVLAADHDIIRDEHTIILFQSLPNAQLCIVPGTTHALRWEKPELINGLLEDFFDQPFKEIDRFWFFKQ